MAELRALRHRNLFLKKEFSALNFWASLVISTMRVVARLRFSVDMTIP